ncbi:unnamed protein product [Trifolium pratense]|uniref:Uncharacterized protein n=1 Tax=Trifolium pratense TaxID=57577 RepID=A0ACB0I8E8_TRIPR|nr:unnamed protein product [Trifolium pratense]
MASLMLSGAENTKLINSIVPSGLGSVSLNFHKKCFLRKNAVSYGNKYRTINLTPRCSVSSTRPSSQPRFIQHKKEAFWFYRFLSIVYDHIINPGHWTEDMREEALEPADLYDRNMRVVDVGGGTGFTTLGIVKHVDAKNVTILDQSPHQLAKAKKKEALKECKIIEGDAEDLPFPTDYADRYVSAGRFLSIVYDNMLNFGPWTEDMREEALEPVDLYDRNMRVVDVGGGTGFSTLGIVKHVDAKNVTIIDQSPHQLAKAKKKEPLKECTIIEGDAENLPFPTDYADRYVSAGSIEYWPDPQRGIKEAYRVLKIGGKACLIGPVHPTFWLSQFFADMWMLFPKEEEYIQWFKNAGFKDVKLKRIGPKWYRGVRRHGLIMGCSVTGVKPLSGDSPLQLGPKVEDLEKPVNPLVFLSRLILGAIAATYYTILPIYMWIKDQIVPKGRPI